MTVEIGFLFVVIIAMVALFLTEKLPVDLTAFTGLVVLVLTGYLSGSQAFTGFSSPAVITMLSIFIISAALLQTGVADFVGSRAHALVGDREIPLIILTMIVAGLLSAFMNNIAATAVLMPAVATIAHRASLAPGRLFMPLSFGAILGGTITMVGTPPNILAAQILDEKGIEPFALFDFAGPGLLLLGVGTVFMVTVGRRLLPSGTIAGADSRARNLATLYELSDHIASLRIPPDSPLDGQTLGESRLGTALGAQVVTILRDGVETLAPSGQTVLCGGDLLTLQGRREDIQELLRVQGVEVEAFRASELPLSAGGASGFSARIRRGSSLIGRNLGELRFRERFDAVVVGVVRGDEILRDRLASVRLLAHDEIIAQGPREKLEELRVSPDFADVRIGLGAFGPLQSRLCLIRIPADSPLVGTTLRDSRLGELVGLTVGGILRQGQMSLVASPEETLQADDRLLIAGDPSRIRDIAELGTVTLESAGTTTPKLESDEIGVVEATVAPRSSVSGRTLGDLKFRDRFGLAVLGLWREGRAIRDDLANRTLRVGDALLLQGTRKKDHRPRR